MAGPWEKYQQAPPASAPQGDGPWAKYASPTATTSDGSTIPVDVVTPGQDPDSLASAFYAAKLKGDEAGATQAFRSIRAQGSTLRPANADEVKAIDQNNGSVGSDTQNAAAGVGKSLVDRARGAGQAAVSLINTAVTPTDYILSGLGESNPIGDAARSANESLKQAQSDANARDTSLMHTKAGFGGYLGGEALQLLAPAAGVKAASALRGVEASPGLMATLAPTTYRGAAIQGAAIGGTEPLTAEQSDTDRLKNVALGGGVGSAGQLGARLLGAGVRGVRALVDPLFAGGQQRIVAGGLARAGENAAINATPSAVAGVNPTLAEATGNAGIGRLTSSLADADNGFSNQLVGRQLDNNAARLNALQSISGTADDLAAAKTARSAAANKLYQGAYASGANVQPTAEMANLAKRPAFQQAIEDAKTLLANEGLPADDPLSSVQGMHYVKLAIDKALAGKSTQGALDATSKRTLTGIKNDFVDEIGKVSPDYAAANSAFRQASGPINQMQVGSKLLGQSVNPLADPLGNLTLMPGKYANAVTNLDAIAQKATGLKSAGASDVLNPQQIKTTQDVLGDLSRKSIADNLGKSRGSNTVQNLAGQNLVAEVTKGAGFPGLANTEVGKAAGSMLNKVYSIVGVPERLKERLGQVLLNPETPESKAILALIPKAMRPAIEAKLGPIFGAIGQTTRVGISQQSALQR